MTFRLSHFLGAIVLLTAGGVVHGMWTHRWAERTPGQGGEDLLARITDPVGDWTPGDFVEIKAINVPDKTQIVSRRFLHEKSNRSLVVSLSSGVPGVVAAHTPDVCYLGSGYKLKNTVTKDSVSRPGGGTAAFVGEPEEIQRRRQSQRQQHGQQDADHGTGRGPESRWARLTSMPAVAPQM